MNSVEDCDCTPGWLGDLLGVPLPEDGVSVEIDDQTMVMHNGILRTLALAAPALGATCPDPDGSPEQTAAAFGFKWRQRATYDSDASLTRMREWLLERYGDVARAGWWDEYSHPPLLLDAGCGAAMSALELFGPLIPRVRYLGVDVSEAVDVAAERFRERGLRGAFLQADLAQLPLTDGSVDVIFSEGVLHHTENPRSSLLALARLLRPGGRILFYVYRRKGPLREFTDDHVRRQLQDLEPAEAWRAITPLTRLGLALGELNAEIEIPEEITLLGIPAGHTTVQRLFYWHVAKAYHHPDLSFDELNHINYDWYAPAYAHRQSGAEVRSWCDAAGLEVERENEQEAGITVIARRQA